MQIMKKVFQQFLTISQILAGIFLVANSSSKFGWYPAKPNFLRQIFGGKYNFCGYGEFSAAWGSSCGTILQTNNWNQNPHKVRCRQQSDCFHKKCSSKVWDGKESLDQSVTIPWKHTSVFTRLVTRWGVCTLSTLGILWQVIIYQLILLNCQMQVSPLKSAYFLHQKL